MNFFIDKIVRDWAWRVNDGMPDLNNRSHLKLLEDTLRAHKYSNDFIEKYIGSIKEGKGDTSATTFYHEIISGIAAVKNVSKKDFKTGADVKRFFDNGTIAPVNAGLSKMSINSLKQARFLDKSMIPNPALVSDAISSGNAIKRKLKFSKVYWSGPTNDASDFGAADIILSNGSAKSGVGVSMKYGKGQLKNLTANTFFQAIMPKANISNFMHHIHGLNSDGFDKMTKEFVNLIEAEFIASGDKEALKSFKSIKNSISTWNTYQRKKIDSDTAKIFSNALDINEKKLKDIRYLGRKLAERSAFKSAWREVRNQFFDIFFGTFLNSNKDLMSGNLGNLLKRQLSVSKKDLWYSASGGSNLKMIPGEESFSRIIKNLEFDQSHSVSGSGYDFILKVKTNGIELGEIKITIRFKTGQMDGYPNTSSSAKWKVDSDEWQKVFS